MRRKRNQSPGSAAAAGLKRYARRKAYTVIEHGFNPENAEEGDRDPEFHRSYATLEAANTAAQEFRDSDYDGPRDFQDNSFKVTKDFEGKVVVGGHVLYEDRYLYVQEKGEAFKKNPVYVVMKAVSLAKPDTRLDVHSVHISIASANICIAALDAEFRGTEEGAKGTLVIKEQDGGLLGLRYTKKGSKKVWVVAEVKFMKQMDFTMEHKGPWDSGRQESEDEAGSDDEDDSEGEEDSEPEEDEPEDIPPPKKKRARRV